MCPETSFDYEIRIVKVFNINAVFHIFSSNVHTVCSVLKSVWTFAHLVSIVNDLRTCSASLETKAALLAWDLSQVCSRSKILLLDHLTWWQNFFSNAIFPVSPNQICHIKVRDFPGNELPEEHTMNSVGTRHQKFHRMLCTPVGSFRLSVQLLQGLMQNSLFYLQV